MTKDFKFKEIALEAFSFLVSEYDFQCVHADEFHLRFESERVFINLLFDARRSYEIGLEVGLLNVPDNPEERGPDLEEILRFVDAPEKETESFFQASTPDRVSKLLPEMAELLKRHGREFLLGEDEAYKAMNDFQKKESDTYELESELEYARPRAEQAWREEDYATYIALLTPLQAHLRGYEVRKLEYARKHM